MTRKDWAFDVREHVENIYAPALAFTADDDQQYEGQITGWIGHENGTTTRAVVIPRGVGPENAARFKRWVTVPRGHWQSMGHRPLGWRAFVLMIGLLPDGDPWWSALYDEALLQPEFAEDKGGFYRFDPGLTQPALIKDWDKDRPADPPKPSVLETLSVYLCTGCRGLFDFAPDDPALMGTCPVCGDDSPLFVFDRTSPPVHPAARAEWDARAEAPLLAMTGK
jgi:hypothetical protein